MRKFAFLLSLTLALSLVLAACSPSVPTQTTAPTSPVGESTLPPVTTAEVTEPPVVVTEAPTAAMTEAPTIAATEAVTAPVATEAVTPAPVVIPGTGLQGDTLASTLLTQTVTASDGQQVGTVGDLAVNLNTTAVDYVILKQEPAEGSTNPTYVPVPWRAIQFTDQGAFLLIDSATLEGATTMDVRAAPIMIPSDWEAEFNAFWDEAVPAGETPMPVEPSGGIATTPTITSTGGVTGSTGITGTGTLTGTGTTTGTTSAGAGTTVTATEPISTSMQGIVLASSFMNMDLTGPNGQSIGKVSDMLINMSTGRVDYVLLQPGEALGLGTANFPVPLQALARDLSTQQFNLPVDLSKLTTAPTFDPSALPDFSQPGWDAQLRTFWQSLMTPSP